MTHAYPCFANYTATLTVTDSAAESDSDSLTIYYIPATPD